MPHVKNLQPTQIKDLPNFDVGDTVKVHQIIREGSKTRAQIFQGLVIARKGGKGVNSTYTVRKVASGVGTERIYPSHSPNVEKVEIVKSPRVTKAKLYYVRKLRDLEVKTRKSPKKIVKKTA